jgi:hypothetical protein
MNLNPQLAAPQPVDFGTVLLAIAGTAAVIIVAYYLRNKKALTNEPDLGNYELYLIGLGLKFEGLVSYAEKKVKESLTMPALQAHLESPGVVQVLASEGLTQEDVAQALDEMQEFHYYALNQGGMDSKVLVISTAPIEDSSYNSLVSQELKWFPPHYESYHRVYAGPASMDIGTVEGWRCLLVDPVPVKMMTEDEDDKLQAAKPQPLVSLKPFAVIALLVRQAAESRDEVMAERAVAQKWYEAFNKSEAEKADVVSKNSELMRILSTKGPDVTGNAGGIATGPSVFVVALFIIMGAVGGMAILPNVFHNAFPTAQDYQGYAIAGSAAVIVVMKWLKKW